MWTHKNKQTTPIKYSNGFTIVELLIVIVVIGILAAITIVAYNGVQQRARSASASAAVTQAAKKLALYQVDNAGYPASGNLAAAGITDTQDVTYQYTGSGSTFCVTATSGNVSYQITDTSNPTPGGCPGHGQGGIAPITNLVRNPNATTNATDWAPISSAGGGPTGSRITGLVPPLTGVTTAYRGTLTGTPSSWWRVQNSQPAPVTPGLPYTLSSYVRSNVTGSTGVIIIWMDSVGATIIESASGTVTQNADSWARRSVTATAPAGAASARLQAYAPTGLGVAGSTIDATGMMFTQTNSLTNFGDGNSPNWAWTGTANNSTSTGPPQ
jgi:prepilin-type N-terminal cleavage/methylation domain-containing protein